MYKKWKTPPYIELQLPWISCVDADSCPQLCVYFPETTKEVTIEYHRADDETSTSERNLHGRRKKPVKFYDDSRYMCPQQSYVSTTIVLQTQKMLKEKVGKMQIVSVTSRMYTRTGIVTEDAWFALNLKKKKPAKMCLRTEWHQVPLTRYFFICLFYLALSSGFCGHQW